MALEQADLGVSPTYWQKSRFPDLYRHKIEVVHDGVDTDAVRPDAEAFLYFPAKHLRLSASDEVITFVSRNLEPYRGFHIFMRSLPELMAARPKAHVVIVGGDEVSYGKRLSGDSYRNRALREIAGSVDLKRVHFVGKIQYNTYLRVLQVSSAHIYLTYPFVLSWSMLEAMAAGCLVVGSRTAPVEEIITDGVNGLLVDFFTKKELLDAVIRALDGPEDMVDIRRQARRTIQDRYDLSRICLPRQRELIEQQV
jgi:glycosyltransferase involved in cell wall biosynthesis